MTLDILEFIAEKEGTPDKIKESQKKRGLPTEIVDEVIQMYAQWVKGLSTAYSSKISYGAYAANLKNGSYVLTTASENWPWTDSFQAAQFNKKINEIQKSITAKKKVRVESSIALWSSTKPWTSPSACAGKRGSR